MKIKHLFPALSASVCLLAVAGSLQLLTARGAQSDPRREREALYQLNNLGVAYMEQYKHEEAAKEFKKAVAADPNFAIGRINLALAYYFQRDMPNAEAEARAAIKLAPDSLHAHYVLGAILKNGQQYDAALEALNKVAAADPRDAATNIQIGQIYSQKQQYEQAIAAFRRALDAEAYNKTAAYSLAQAYLRAGRAAEGQKMLAHFQQLNASGYATTLGLTYGEQGRYAEAITSTGAEADLVSKEMPAVRFVDAAAAMGLNAHFNPTGLASALGRKLTQAELAQEATRRELVAAFSTSLGLLDYDHDCKLDLFATGSDSDGKPLARLFHNDGGKFSDVTERSKTTVGGPAAGAIFGDFDNDGKQDISIFGYRLLALYRNNGDGTFAEVTAKSGLPAHYDAWALTAAFVDHDHDGDLDLFVGNFADLSRWPGGESAIFPDDFAGTPNKLYRNNGQGSFTDITDQAGLSGGANKTTAVVCSDFDNRRDIDFLVVNYRAPVQLFSNQRDGTFKEIASQVGINFTGKSLGAAAGDFNKDSFTDFYITDIESVDALYLSDGRGGFASKAATSRMGGIAAQSLDYDNDGLLDAVTLTNRGIRLWRGLGGSGNFADTTEALSSFKPAGVRAVAAGDINSDGGIDLLAINADGALAALRSEGASKNYASLALEGKTSNRSGVGAKAELRSGSLSQKLEVYASSPAPAAAGLTFGLGYRTAVDALRLLWPAGIVQSELTVKTGACSTITELDRKGTSCPLLYAWNGREYSFVTDFLGGSAIGYLTAPGQWNYPDTDEYVRLTGDQLKERDGIYSLRLNNQLEEVIYFDAVKLLAVDHPAETEIHPNERLMPAPPYPEFKIYSVKGARPPASAVDDQGQDILPLITNIDRRYPEGFKHLRFKGYAREHAITLQLGDVRKAKRVLLLLTAWIDYADSTANLAAAQAGAKLIPPYLQVKNARGEWRTVIPQMGFPAGLPKTMTVDLTGKFLCDDASVRIVTSMRIYWDQILVDASGGDFPMRVTRLDPLGAELGWRGFPREYSPDGRRPLIYDYRVIEPGAPWKAHLGNYTRYGEVRELLLAPDDMYVITRNGDEMQVDFDARALPPLPRGWKRDFLLYADGFGKDMDLHSARPDTVGELPYHGMKSYPYSPSDRYPIAQRHREYLERYNTRRVTNQEQAAWRGVR
jgi:tetratricopeptide (TPR) repeat protein